jgi:hypothetical protein
MLAILRFRASKPGAEGFRPRLALCKMIFLELRSTCVSISPWRMALLIRGQNGKKGSKATGSWFRSICH